MSLGVAAPPRPVPPHEPRRHRRGPTGARATRHVYDPAHADPRVLALLGHGADSESSTQSQSQNGSSRQLRRRTARRPTTAPARGAEREELESQKALAPRQKKDAKVRWRGSIRATMIATSRFVAPGLGGGAPASTGPLSGIRVDIRTKQKIDQMILTTKQEEADAAAKAAAAEALLLDEDDDGAAGEQATSSPTTNPSLHAPHNAGLARKAWAYAKKLTVNNAVNISAKMLTDGILQESLRAAHALKSTNDANVTFDAQVALQEAMSRRVRDLKMLHSDVAKRIESAGLKGPRLSKANWLQEVVNTQSDAIALFDIRDYKKHTFKERECTTAYHELTGKRHKNHVPSHVKTCERLEGGDYELVSTEHTTMSLRRRLTAGNTMDTKAVEQASKYVPTTAIMQKMHDTIVSLNGLANSKYTEIQRDAAAAFNSLSLSEDSMPAFVTSHALPTVVHLAQSQDLEILNDIVEAVGRLCQHPLIKRPFVEVGGLTALHKFSESPTMAAEALYALMGLCCHDPPRGDKLKYAHLKPNADDKLPITTAEKGYFVRFIFKCTLASTGANDRPDPKTRRWAIATLISLLDGPENMLAMLHAGALERFIKLLRSRDSHMRFGSATGLTNLMKLQPAANVPLSACEKVREDVCLVAAFAALADAVDIDSATALLNLVQAAITHVPDGVSKSKLRNRMIRLGCADVLMKHAVRLLKFVEVPSAKESLLSKSKASSQLMLLRSVTTTLLELLQGQTALKMFIRLEANHLNSVMKLVKAKDKRTCRHGSRLLGRLSTLPEAKQKILEHPSNLPQLLSLLVGKLHVDVSATIARVLAELAEAWQNRVPLVSGGVLTALRSLLTTSWAIATKFDCARCLADLAEAVDNREAIASCCVPELSSLLQLKAEGPREQAMRCIRNLVDHAGSQVAVIASKNALSDGGPASPSKDELPGRYGLTNGVEYGMLSDGEEAEGDDEEEDDEEDDNEHGEDCKSIEQRADPQSSQSCISVWRRSIGAVAPLTFARLNDVTWWGTDEGKQFTAVHNNVTREKIHMYIVSDSQFMGQMMAMRRDQNANCAQHATSVIQQLTQPSGEATARARLSSDAVRAAGELVNRRLNEGRQVGFRITAVRAPRTQ